LPDGDCDNSFNEQTSQFFICGLDNQIEFPAEVTVFNQEFTIIFAKVIITEPYQIVEVGNENLCTPSISVFITSPDQSKVYKLFTVNTSCETQPIYIGDTFSAFKVVEFINPNQGVVEGCKTNP